MPTRALRRNPVVQALLPVGSRRRAVVRGLVRRSSSTTQPAKPSPRKVAIRQEETKLRQSWSRHRADMLDIYLVSGFQDPRLNAQSILERHMLVRAMFGSEFDDLIHEELAYAVELNDAIRLRAQELGVLIKPRLRPTAQADVQRVMEVVAGRAPTFAKRWRDALAGREVPPLRVFEFACGSANDYRALADYGIARFLDYTGIDLNEKNIANARRRFPGVDFRVGSILSLTEPDRSIDYVIACDIFEHLSLQGMQTAVAAAVRICRRGLYVGFFRMDEVPEHEEVPRRQYHYNMLSAPRMREYMQQRFTSMQLVHVRTMLKDDYGYPHSHNPHAYSLIAEGLR